MIFATVLGLSDQFARYDRNRLIVGTLIVLFAVFGIAALLSMKRSTDDVKKRKMRTYFLVFTVLAAAAVIAFGIITLVFAPTESLPAY